MTITNIMLLPMLVNFVFLKSEKIRLVFQLAVHKIFASILWTGSAALLT